ncbi:MAG: hypothetical protein ABI693_27135 [Bryobacteraceae bacterium]
MPTTERREQSLTKVAANYLQNYKLKHHSGVFAEDAIGHATRHLGAKLKRAKGLELKAGPAVGKAYSSDQKTEFLNIGIDTSPNKVTSRRERISR